MSFKRIVSFLLIFLAVIRGFGHPMPSSLVLVEVHKNSIVLNLRLPISELELAFGRPLSRNTQSEVPANAAALKSYLQQHIRLIDANGKAWTTSVTAIASDSTSTEINGVYKELLATVELLPTSVVSNNRDFLLYYDVIIHQVVTHNALVSVVQDWENGVINKEEQSIGVIELDTKNNVVRPFKISLQKGSWWKGFSAMFRLGVWHILEGADHLLFLLVLLLPAPLIVVGKRWRNGGTVRYTLIRVVKFVTAFTIGHSVTLIAASLHLLQLPSKPVEVFIALTILVTAIHNIKPIFYGKEFLLVVFFGCIHGLAFGSVISSLNLPGTQLALSIVGFNLGIECVQLAILCGLVPVLLWFSNKPAYMPFKNAGAVAAIVMSLIWVAQRLQ